MFSPNITFLWAPLPGGRIYLHSWQLHVASSVYPIFWDHWAFIYSHYCSYSSLIHSNVLPTTRHVSEERKPLDVGEIFFFYQQRRNKTLGIKIMSAWLICLNWRREVFVNYHRTTGHIGQYFTLSAKFWLQELHSSEQFLEGRKEPWNFGSKGWKFYIITFLTFLSQHFDQERVSFSKVNTGAHANWIYDRGVYLQNLLRVGLWC